MFQRNINGRNVAEDVLENLVLKSAVLCFKILVCLLSMEVGEREGKKL